MSDTGHPMAVRYRRSPAGFWLRVAAVLIDGLVIAIPGVVIQLLATIIFAVPAAGVETEAEAAAIFSVAAVLGQIVVFIVQWLYYALMESSSKRGTLGKMALGLQVTNLQGQTIGFGQATGRYFAKFLSVITLGIGFIIAAFTERKQGLHDLVAGTLVLKRRPADEPTRVYADA